MTLAIGAFFSVLIKLTRVTLTEENICLLKDRKQKDIFSCSVAIVFHQHVSHCWSSSAGWDDST